MRLRSPALLLLLLSGLQTFDIQEEEVRAMVGSDVVLNCIHTKESSFNLTELHVYWQTDVSGKTTVVTYSLENNTSVGHDNNQYKGRAQVSLDSMKRGDFSLHLRNITPQDERKFHCLVFQKLEKILEVVVMLHVAANYSMPVVSTPSSATQDKELSITCTSTGGYPRPNVYWINKTDNSLLDEALQNNTVSVNALGLYDVVSVLRVHWAPNLNVECCIENVLLLQNLTVSSQTETDTLMGTIDSITNSPGDTHEGRAGAVAAVAAVLVAAVAVVAVAVGRVHARTCPCRWTYTAGARAARPELQLTEAQWNFKIRSAAGDAEPKFQWTRAWTGDPPKSFQWGRGMDGEALQGTAASQNMGSNSLGGSSATQLVPAASQLATRDLHEVMETSTQMPGS